MMRVRRYRAFVVFAVVFVVVFFHFSHSRDWAPLPVYAPTDDGSSVSSNSLAAGSKDGVTTASPSPAAASGYTPDKDVNGPFADIPSTSLPNVPSPSPQTDRITQTENEDSGARKLASTPGALSEKSPFTDERALLHWGKPTERYALPTKDIIPLPTGRPMSIPKLQAEFKDESSSAKMSRLQKLGAVKEAFGHAWTGYKAFAMGHDEVLPATGGSRDPFNGWGATLVDALDTLWMMGMTEEFTEAIDEVKKIDFAAGLRKDLQLFETTIRYLGGLLGAYDVSGQKYQVLLDKAIELAEVLIGAFDTPNRMPMTFYQWTREYASPTHLGDSKAVLAEVGSLSLEFTRLAQLTKQDKYYDAVARITNELETLQSNTKLPGMWPLKVDASGCELSTSGSGQKSPVIGKQKRAPGRRRRPGGVLLKDAQPADYDEMSKIQIAPDKSTLNGQSLEAECTRGLQSPLGRNTFGVGALADSTYEYLPKEYMLLGGLEDKYRAMYENAMDSIRKYLLYRPMVRDDRDIRFVARVDLAKPLVEGEKSPLVAYHYEGSHLGCFAGGMFAVGAKIFGIDGDMDTAAKLTDGCVWAYETTQSGIMPELFTLFPCDDMEFCSWNETRYIDVLDPDEEGRIERANRVYEQRLKWSKETENALEKAAAQAALPLKAPTDDSAVPDKPTVLSHAEYAQSRIKTERLPPGFVSIEARKYILRPEAIESVFIMYRLSGDDYWREKGWDMFQAVTKHTRTELAHSAVSDVTEASPPQTDQMESFWLAETLKYYYLLFSDPGLISLDEYVLNTEAHPFKRPGF